MGTANSKTTGKKGLLVSAAPAPVIAPNVLPDLTGKVGPAAPALTISSIEAGNKVRSAAIEAADKLSENQGVVDDIEETLDAGEKTKRGPLVLRQYFIAAMGMEWMNGRPVPDSKGGNNPDIFQTTEKAGDGSVKTVDASFYDVLADNMKNGAAVAQQIVLIDAAIKNRENGKDDADNEYSKCANPAQFAAERKLWTDRKSALRSLVRRAFTLHFQKIDADNLPKIKVEFLTYKRKDGAVEMSSSTTPIMLFDNSDAPKSWATWKKLSVGQFLAFDLAAAKENGGTMEAVVATTAKGAGAEGKGKGIPLPTIDTIDSFAAQMLSYLEEKNNGAAYAVHLAKADDHTVRTWGNLKVCLDAIYPRISNRFIRLVNKDQAAAEQGAAEQQQ